MRLIANVHQNLEGLTVAIDVVGHRIVREIDLFDPFCQADNRDLLLQPQPLQGLIGKSQLSFAAIHDDQLGKFCPLG